jgi:methyl-accepting chemotaxis protein
MNIKQRMLFMAIGITTISLIGNGLVTYKSIQINHEIEPIEKKNVPLLKTVSALISEFALLRGDAWRHIAESNDSEIQQLNRTMPEREKRIDALSKEIQGLVRGDEERRRLARLDKTVDRYLSAWSNVKVLSDAKRNEEACNLYRATMKPLFDELLSELEAIATTSRNLVDESVLNVNDHTQSQLWIAVIAVCLVALVGAGFTWISIRQTGAVVRESISGLQAISEELKMASGQVARAAQFTAKGSTEQAGMVDQIHQSANSIREITVQNDGLAEGSLEIVEKSKVEYEETRERLTQSTLAMTKIEASSNKIAKIIKVIDEIAFQTNILALNAAVEAARAGQAGMGFAVVAEEVRNLAQRCADAARNTTELIQESIENSEEGKTRLGELGKVFEGLSTAMESLGNQVRQVRNASQHQLKGVGLIGGEIAKLELETKKVAGISEETAASADELQSQASQLTHLVESIKTVFGS